MLEIFGFISIPFIMIVVEHFYLKWAIIQNPDLFWDLYHKQIEKVLFKLPETFKEEKSVKK